MTLVNLFPEISTPFGKLPVLIVTGPLGIIANVAQANLRKRNQADPNYPITLSLEEQRAAEESIDLLEKIRVITTTFGISVVAAIGLLAYVHSKKDE